MFNPLYMARFRQYHADHQGPDGLRDMEGLREACRQEQRRDDDEQEQLSRLDIQAFVDKRNEPPSDEQEEQNEDQSRQ